MSGLSVSTARTAWPVWSTSSRPFSRARLPAADKNSLVQFGATSAGRILVSEWGADAARRLAVALHRWDRLTADLSDDEFDQLDDFFRVRLQPQERAAILRRLAT